MKNIYILNCSCVESDSELTINEPEVFTSKKDARAALIERYEEELCGDVYESDIDKENLTAYIISNSDEYTGFVVQKVAID